MATFGLDTGGVDLKSISEMEFGGALWSDEGREFAKENGRKLVVNKKKQKGTRPKIVLVLKSANED